MFLRAVLAILCLAEAYWGSFPFTKSKPQSSVVCSAASRWLLARGAGAVGVFSKAEQPENLKFMEETQSEMSPHPPAPCPLLGAASVPAAGPGSTCP